MDLDIIAALLNLSFKSAIRSMEVTGVVNSRDETGLKCLRANSCQ